MTGRILPGLMGISVSKLDYWRARYRRQDSDRPGFLEIVNNPEPALLEVVYPGGVMIRVKVELATAHLRQLLTYCSAGDVFTEIVGPVPALSR